MRYDNWADYHAELTANRAHYTRADYLEAFDNLTASGYWGGFPYARKAGPNERPVCDECETLLKRDTQGVWDDGQGHIYCSEECCEAYRDSMMGDYYDEPQEDFRADLGIGPCYHD